VLLSLLQVLDQCGLQHRTVQVAPRHGKPGEVAMREAAAVHERGGTVLLQPLPLRASSQVKSKLRMCSPVPQTVRAHK
jgi:hypothetical protein